MSIESGNKNDRTQMPDVDDSLLKKSAHFTVRERHPVTRRLIYKQFPIKDFNFDRFDETYEIVRPLANYRNRQRRIGWVWLATTGRSVEFESGLERMILLQLDQDPNVKQIWSQPFRIEGIDNKRGRAVRTRPDILVRLSDGSAAVVQVKPKKRLSEPERYEGEPLKKFGSRYRRWETMTANMAWEKKTFRKLEWAYEIVTEPHPQVSANLRYMRVYRRPLSPTDPISDKVLELIGDRIELEFGELADLAGGHHVAAPVILHHVWHNRIKLDWKRQLSQHSIVRSPEHATEQIAA